MASIKCGHCHDTHDSVSEVEVCANMEWQAEADYLAEAAIYAREIYETERDLSMSGECPHGLSAWLCADPINHYPRDNDLSVW